MTQPLRSNWEVFERVFQEMGYAANNCNVNSGHWSMRMNEIRTCGFQKGDRVQWTNSDDDIPEGDIGIVMGVKYKEDSGNKLYVNWPKGRYSMDPLFLQARLVNLSSFV